MDLLMRHIAALLLALPAAGCASSSASSHRASSQDTGTLVVDASLVGAAAKAPVLAATEVGAPAAGEEVATTTVITTSKTREVLPPAPPAPNAPTMPAAPVVAAAKPQAAAVAAPSAQPLLDIATLKARLRETSAIGIFAKLSLRSQMDELVEQFRAHHLSGLAGGIASMRPPYDALVLKVLAAVREGDPSLARLISESREALWQLLADPLKFDSVT